MSAIAIYKGVKDSLNITIPATLSGSTSVPVLYVNTKEQVSFSGTSVMELSGSTISGLQSVIDITTTDSDVDVQTYFFNIRLEDYIIDTGTITVLPTTLMN